MVALQVRQIQFAPFAIPRLMANIWVFLAVPSMGQEKIAPDTPEVFTSGLWFFMGGFILCFSFPDGVSGAATPLRAGLCRIRQKTAQGPTLWRSAN